MSESQSSQSDSDSGSDTGSDNQGERPVAQKESGKLPNVGEKSSRGEETGTDKRLTTSGQNTRTSGHKSGPSNQASGSSSRPGQCHQTVTSVTPSIAQMSERSSSDSQVGAVLHRHRRLSATDEEIKQIDFTLDFIAWILKSNFLLSQQLEPLVGGPLADFPLSVEEWGIKGQSVYTALFDHTDMETYSCKLCPHIVQDDLEGAITHERLHFRHYPFQCSGTPASSCGLRFESQAAQEEHQLATTH